MWLLFIFAGLLAVSAEKETVTNAAEKSSSSPTSSADDIVMLEIDVKEPVKRSPISASAVYGASPSQYVIRHGDDAQELSPEYLSVLQQYTQSQPQSFSHTTAAPPPQRRPLPAYARQQQQLQQAYYNYRKPTVVPPRPRAQLHSQALAQAEATAQVQAQIDAKNRAEALHSARSSPNAAGTSTYQVAAYSEPKLGTFEQELLQLVSANQAQEFKLVPTQPKSALKSGYGSEYSQQLVSFPNQYSKPSASASQLPEQYHIETTPQRYQQQPAHAYQSVEEPVQVQYQPVQALPVQAKEFRPSPQYEYHEDANLKAAQHAQAQAEAEQSARAQAHAQAQALAYQKITQAAHNKHHQDALQEIQIVNERYRQQSALEQIQQGTQVSDAGRAHIEEQYHPKDPEAAYRARLKAQAQAELAEARRAHETAENKAHADAILKLQAQQQAHLKAQEDAHKYALNFEKNQLQAQAQAQAIAQAQAEALYKVYQQSRAKANNHVLAVARAQVEARKHDPENTPVLQYVLPDSHSGSTPLPPPNSYYTSDEVQKYQASGSSYVPRSVPKDEAPRSLAEELQQTANQPRQTHKLKIPSNSPSSVYVSQSGLLKKAPVKSLTIEEIIEQDQINGPQVVRIPTPKGQQALTQEELSALINSGYAVTPIPQTVRPTQQTYVEENSSAGYYVKKQRNPVARPEYITYEDAIPQARKPTRKNRPTLRSNGGDGEASEKVTYLVPLEPEFGTRQPPARRVQK
ncbi:hypothetical protein KPH14_001929 [Odynerus spinipes]|uniref:Uncharacterized protein n=1 Tax=Odynerus spinipes TaxID=1348599 RepID=A0AAD9S0Z3_9HYME|nr:hypothetical protein KPH14_001929 [Odynerus spinipes]